MAQSLYDQGWIKRPDDFLRPPTEDELKVFNILRAEYEKPTLLRIYHWKDIMLREKYDVIDKLYDMYKISYFKK